MPSEDALQMLLVESKRRYRTFSDETVAPRTARDGSRRVADTGLAATLRAALTTIDCADVAAGDEGR